MPRKMFLQKLALVISAAPELVGFRPRFSATGFFPPEKSIVPVALNRPVDLRNSFYLGDSSSEPAFGRDR